MSRLALFLGLLISVGFHLWLVLPTKVIKQAVGEDTFQRIVEVVAAPAQEQMPQPDLKTEPEQVEPEPKTPDVVDKPDPEPDPKPDPKPEPDPETLKEPESIEPTETVAEPKPVPSPAPHPKSQPTPDPSPNPEPTPKTADSVPAKTPVDQDTDLASPKADGQGSFAGSPEGKGGPELRIHWGDQRHALRLIAAARMRLIVLESSPAGDAARASVAIMGDQAKLAPLAASRGYSSRVRVVHDVPAFAPIVGQLELRSPQRLAVMVPSNIETMLQSAQLTAVFRRGITLDAVKYFGGRFVTQHGKLAFEITRVQTH